jgi:EAL domain-containing protein (putative c-di-GMP-specific phosphodiesterase class I)
MELITYSLKETFHNRKHKDHFFNIISATVIAPKDGNTDIILMKNLLSTLKRAKTQKSHLFFSNELKEASSRRILITNELRKEIRNFKYSRAYYQAKLNNAGKVIGAEVLSRWFHPEIGFISPGEFIPIAESSGMILDISQFILEETFRNISSIKNISDDFKIARNLSSIQLADETLPQKISILLKNYNIAPKHIELEVTESMLQDNISKTITSLKKFKEIGISIALDDFGTGYSSLTYLKELPIDILKIDQSFIFSMHKSKKELAIVETIIALGKNLGMKLVAEGVETKEDVKILKEKKCDYFQGYYFHKPSTWDDFIKYMNDMNNNLP